MFGNKFALCLKHLIQQFPTIFETDEQMLMDCWTNVWKLTCEASLSLYTTRIDHTRSVIKSFYCNQVIINYVIMKNWVCTHNFCDAVDLVVQCGGEEISLHLIMAPKNTTYMPPEYISKYPFT